MRAFAVLQDAPTIIEIELPSQPPTGTEIVLDVIRSGVCHTDMHLRSGAYDLGSRGEMRLVDRGIPYPLVMGHEVVGRVVAVGDGVDDIAPGDIRLVFPWLGCGACAACLDDQENACARGRNIGVARPGGYAEQIVVPHPRYLLDIGALDLSWAATLACSGLTAFSAVRKALPASPDDPVVVIGAGGVGLMAVSVLSVLGHHNIGVVDLAEGNLALAVERGAHWTVLSARDDVRPAVAAAGGGPLAASIDFVNTGVTASLAFDSLAKGGRMVQVGLFGGEFVLPTALLALKMVTIQGSFVGSLGELRELVELAQTGKLPDVPTLAGQLTADGVGAALDRLASGGVPGRIVLQPVSQS